MKHLVHKLETFRPIIISSDSKDDGMTSKVVENDEDEEEEPSKHLIKRCNAKALFTHLIACDELNR